MGIWVFFFPYPQRESVYCYSVRLSISKLSDILTPGTSLYRKESVSAGSLDCFQSLGCNLFAHYLVLLCMLFSLGDTFHA